MPSNDRALYHITDPVTEITRGAPSSSEGSDGDKRFAYIPDRGLYHFVKHSGKWHSSAVYQEDISPLTKNGLQTENLTSKHDIRMAPARNVEIKEKKSMGTGEFTQGFTGNGWRLRHVDNEYNLEVDSMTVRGTLHVFEMLIQQLRATNGTVIIASAAKADSATSTTITFDDPSDHGVCPFAVNDIVMCQRVNLNSTTVVKRIVRRVTDVNGATITVVRDGDLPGDTATVVKGDDFVRIGNTTNTSRQGGVLLTADMTNAPFIEIFDNVSSWATWTATDKIKARLGQLKGITDADANLDDETKFGLYTNDVNLKGHLFSQSGEIAGWTLGNTTISKNNTELSSAGTLTLGTSSDIIKLSSIDSTYRIWAGHTSGASANFSVEKDGTLYATGATISGAITITGGNAETTTGSQTKATAAQVAATAAAATDATSKAAAAELAAKNASLLRASYLTSNTTTINGGTITTGSIAAATISANSITADQIDTANITAAVVTSTSVNATTINADRILAGTLSASRIAALDMTGKTCTFDTGSFGGWSINSNGMYRGTAVASGSYTGSASDITIGAGWISANKFRVDSDGTAHFKGTLDANTTGTLSHNNCSLTDITADNITAGTISAAEINMSNGSAQIATSGKITTKNLVKCFSTDVGGSRMGLRLIEHGDTSSADSGSTNWWQLFVDSDDLIFNKGGYNKVTFDDNGKMEANAGANEFTPNHTRMRLESSDTGSDRWYEIYNTDTEVSTNHNIGGLRWYSNDSSNSSEHQGWVCSIGGVNYYDGRMGLTFRHGGVGSADDFYTNFVYDGDVINGTNTTVWQQTSDERVKENIVEVDDALSVVTALRPVTFNFNSDYCEESGHKDNKRWGFLGQEFKTAIPEGVTTSADYGYEDFHKLNSDMLVPILVKAVQELKAEVEQLKNSD